MQPHGLRLICFGAPRITQNHQTVTLKRRKSLALLVYLAVVRRPVERAALIDLLWPDAAPSVALSSLRNVLADLNATPVESFLSVDRHTVTLSPDLDSDVKQFMLLLKHTKETPFMPTAAESTPSRATLAMMEQIANLITGQFLEGFGISDAPMYDDWRIFRQHEFQQQAQQLLMTLVQHYAKQGEAEHALIFAQRLCELDNTDETAAALLMNLHMRLNEPEQALQVYHLLKRILKREFNCEPQPSTHALYKAIVSGKVAFA